MNTMDYRVSCQMLKYLHQENALGSRFPIGMTEQVKQWDRDMIKEFWKTWYYPANMTLYVVGVLPDGVEATKKLIQETFGDVTVNTEQSAENDGKANVAVAKRIRQSLRPPVEHVMG